MARSSAKRIAALAVTRYAADRARVRQTCRAVRRAGGSLPDLLAALVAQALLTPQQAEELQNLEQPLSAAASAVPRTLAGYRILRQLGEGGMGSVYLGYHEALDRPVAIKVLTAELADNPVCVACFQREAHTGARLDHPNLVRGFSAGRDETTGLHYLVREFVDGPSGHALLDRLGRLPVGDVVHVALDVGRALEYLHERQLVHRDIKPDNILLSSTGTAKLTDLGLVRRLGERPTAMRFEGFGTSYYMPCEQASNAPAVDGRSDLYALGATLYHLLTGQVPFPGDSHPEIMARKESGHFVPASALNPEVPAELDAILERALARSPADRYQTARQLLDVLEGSGLAPAVPSFAGLDWSRLTPGEASQPTSLDPLAPRKEDAPNPLPPADTPTTPPGLEGHECWPTLLKIGLSVGLLALLGTVLGRLVLTS